VAARLESFRNKYARARVGLMDFYAEQILIIAFDESGGILINTPAEPSRSRAQS
jgi:hypothetical protein